MECLLVQQQRPSAEEGAADFAFVVGAADGLGTIKSFTRPNGGGHAREFAPVEPHAMFYPGVARIFSLAITTFLVF